MKSITGQYECLHRSGVGLDYFTSRIDRLILQGNGRFVLIVQDASRIASAAQALMKGQQVSAGAQETRREGNYSYSGNSVMLRYDDGMQEQGEVSPDGQGMQIGSNFFNKVSDSTLLPSTHRLKKDMEDIAKGIKIAKTIGGMAISAAKTIQETLQTAQQQQQPSTGRASSPAPQDQAQNAYPYGQAQPVPPPSWPPEPAQNAAQHVPPQGDVETLFCDQCGARVRPGKRFCNQCGARLS